MKNLLDHQNSIIFYNSNIRKLSNSFSLFKNSQNFFSSGITFKKIADHFFSLINSSALRASSSLEHSQASYPRVRNLIAIFVNFSKYKFWANFGKNMSLFCQNRPDNIQSCLTPGRYEITPNIIWSCNRLFLCKTLIEPMKQRSIRKATLAKRAIEIDCVKLSLIRNCSIIRLLAPIIFTGFAALSVETQK